VARHRPGERVLGVGVHVHLDHAVRDRLADVLECRARAAVEDQVERAVLAVLGAHRVLDPIAQFGLEVSSDGAASGRLFIDYIDWSGTPTTVFRRPQTDSKMWRRAWINAVDHVGTRWASAFHLSQNRGTGLFIQGSRDWRSYTVQSAIMSDPAKSFGLAARVQGLSRYYALMLGPNQVLRLIRNYDGIQVLAEVPYSWNWSERYQFKLEVNGPEIAGSLNGTEVIRFNDSGSALVDGGIALVFEEGLIMTDEVRVTT
jgi:hypothetical protein